MGEGFGQKEDAGSAYALHKILRPLLLLAEWVAALNVWPSRLMAILFGALSALALPPFHFIPFLFIGFAGFVWLLDGIYCRQENMKKRQPLWHAALMGWCFGFGFFLVGLYWIGFAFLVEAEDFAWMIPFVAVLMPGGLALFTGIAAALAVVLWRPGAGRLALFAAFWMGAEWLRGHILTGFPWNLIGYVWADSAAISQTGALVGIYGLGLLTILFCLAPAVIGPKTLSSRRPFLWLGAALILFMGLWVNGFVRLLEAPNWEGDPSPQAVVQGVTLRLVQPSVPQAEKWKPGNGPGIFELYQNLSTGPGYENITHIVWPESAVPYILSREPEKLDTLAQMLGHDRALLTGSVRIGFNGLTGKRQFHNSLHVIEAEPTQPETPPSLPLSGHIVANYDKVHLVPFGEYLPLSEWAERIGLKQMVFGSGGYTPGAGVTTLPVPGLPEVAPLICYEVIFPGKIIAPGSQPGLLLNVTNDAWFGDSSGPRQHFQMARMRAIESGLPLVRSANNGISAVIDAYGQVVDHLPLNARGVVDSPLPLALSLTTYRRWGDSIFVFILGLVLVSGLLSAKRSL